MMQVFVVKKRQLDNQGLTSKSDRLLGGDGLAVGAGEEGGAGFLDVNGFLDAVKGGEVAQAVPCLASTRPPESLATTGMPRSMLSMTISPKPSYHSDGMSSTRVRASTSSIWRALGRKRTFGRRSSARRSLAVVPQPGTTPNSVSGRRAATSRKIGSPLTAQGLIILTNPVTRPAPNAP